MHPNAQRITDLYTAFQKLDAEAMARCYHPQARFSDPVFVDLRGPEVTAMWRMLCRRASNFRLEFRDVQADEHQGSAHWEAWYTFGKAKRPVHNIISSRFVFQDGLIVEQVDDFEFHRWAKQALGVSGRLFGRVGLIQRQVQRRSRKMLREYQNKA
jgi:hypothetical protein